MKIRFQILGEVCPITAISITCCHCHLNPKEVLTHMHIHFALIAFQYPLSFSALIILLL
uniref:Uncharacterized protein n=1 Tax=Anguilla anguilla TaxID=7936 RepID=A0A0E9WXL0_ANGAN